MTMNYNSNIPCNSSNTMLLSDVPCIILTSYVHTSLYTSVGCSVYTKEHPWALYSSWAFWLVVLGTLDHSLTMDLYTIQSSSFCPKVSSFGFLCVLLVVPSSRTVTQTIHSVNHKSVLNPKNVKDLEELRAQLRIQVHYNCSFFKLKDIACQANPVPTASESESEGSGKVIIWAWKSYSYSY